MTNREKRGTNRTYGWEAGAVWERQFFKKLLAKSKSVLKSRKSEFDGYLDDEKVLSSEIAENFSHPNNSEFFEINKRVEEEGESTTEREIDRERRRERARRRGGEGPAAVGGGGSGGKGARWWSDLERDGGGRESESTIERREAGGSGFWSASAQDRCRSLLEGGVGRRKKIWWLVEVVKDEEIEEDKIIVAFVLVLFFESCFYDFGCSVMVLIFLFGD
ncbi:hypothetical protein RJT34_30869 [Clitoria ternatea]|uniref:Uncharacterized protein n=1 Tax=Clitoria ternatea TaxID=43366 RepID=A0AAN9ET90_CLITE